MPEEKFIMKWIDCEDGTTSWGIPNTYAKVKKTFDAMRNLLPSADFMMVPVRDNESEDLASMLEACLKNS